MQRLIILLLSLTFVISVSAADVTKTTIDVNGMTCNACVDKVTSELQKVEGVKKVSVDLESGKATVEHNGVELALLNSAIVKAGFNTQSSGSKNYECDEAHKRSCLDGEKAGCCSQAKCTKKEI